MGSLFCKYQNRLSHPIYFLFLPYYLFFQLAKCEKLISPDAFGAFSLPQLNKNEPNWTIRNSPFLIKKESDFEQLDELYVFVEDTLSRTLCNSEYHSIGGYYLSAACRYSNQYGDPQKKKYRKKDIEELTIEYTAHFSVPLLSYDIWASRFCEQFDTETGGMLNDISRVFKLMLRPPTKPAQRTADEILQKHAQHRTNISGQVFVLPELINALCTVHNVRYFNSAGPFKDKQLRESVNLLTDFLIACNIFPIQMRQNQPDEKWLELLRYGCPTVNADTKFRPDDVTSGFVNPSRILYRAIWMRAHSEKTKIPGRYGLTSFFPYSKSVKMFFNGLYHMLFSEKIVLRHIAYWGGIKVELDDEYVRSLEDAFNLWTVWNGDSEEKFLKFYQLIKNKAEELNAALSKLHPFCSKPVTVDLSGLDFDSESSEILLEQKQQLFLVIPELKTIFGQPKRLDDLQYTYILYFLFRVLRNQMCRQASELSAKLWQLT